ncbi:MAG: acyl-CoA dehydrogenase family protein [Anaerolineales bacterium]|nr:acyl-CoA dehydrogenase family protein [Anaerolineales bacterium]
MILLNPKQHLSLLPDERSREIMRKTIAFFENKGLKKVKEDDHAHSWYADLLEFVKREKIFATLLTPAAYGDDSRWDTWRNCEFNEILAFYGLAYWYTWQVSILGLGPIWMSRNEALKRKAAQLLKEGNVFAFGLSERTHGADIYSTEMSLTPQPDGTYRANGEKYYIGNANLAPMVSTFGKMADTGEYVFFSADYRHKNYELIRNVCASQNYVGQYALHDYPISNVNIFKEQIAVFKEFLAFATPDEAQQKDVDFLLALGEIFTLVVYGQLILENAKTCAVGDDLLDQIADFMVRDFSKHALNIYSKPSSTPQQMDFCLRMMRKPAVDANRFGRVWEEVYGLKDAYEMTP